MRALMVVLVVVLATLTVVISWSLHNGDSCTPTWRLRSAISSPAATEQEARELLADFFNTSTSNHAMTRQVIPEIGAEEVFVAGLDIAVSRDGKIYTRSACW